jgi:two-component system OmpR family sensor kinase
MRNLTLSLLAVVLIATIGLGWIFDGIYNQYLNQNINNNLELSRQGNNRPQSVIDTLEQVGTHLSIALSGINNR